MSGVLAHREKGLQHPISGSIANTERREYVTAFLLGDGMLLGKGRLSLYARRGTSCMCDFYACYESYDTFISGLGCVALVWFWAPYAALCRVQS